MRLDLSVLGWIHTVACVAAIWLGAVNLLRTKGTPLHRRIGQAYLCAIVVLSLTGLLIYRLNRFFFPHWLAIATLVLAVAAFTFARFRWPARLWYRAHMIATVLTYYLLLGGGVNEAFLRIDVLRRLSGGFPSPVIGWTHRVLMALTLMVLISLLIRHRSRRFGAALKQ